MCTRVECAFANVFYAILQKHASFSRLLISDRQIATDMSVLLHDLTVLKKQSDELRFLVFL